MADRILIIEDERLIRWSLRQKFEQKGYAVSEAERGQQGLDLLDAQPFDLVLLDHKLPDMTGLDVLRRLHESNIEVLVVMMTAYSNVEDAVEAIKLGAFDYLPKPFEMDLLLAIVAKALETTKLRREVIELRRHLQHNFGFDRIIGKHASMQRMLAVINEVAQSSATTVFLRGETGTGKDLVARVIHYNSERAPHPFMNITCTAISETLLESELFGHERGAFTDAKSRKKGLFELADGGTVYLDEVGDMPAGLQSKLLRFLEEKTLRRVGGTEEITVDVRILAATNRDVERAIEEGKFRRDLLYRLNVINIHIPPLRERGRDLELLAQHFVDRFAEEFKKSAGCMDEGAREKLSGYPWPGNVRELRNVCERAVLLSRSDTLTASDILVGRVERRSLDTDIHGLQLTPKGIDFNQLEFELLRQSLERSNNNQTQAAKLLNLTRNTFRYRLEKHGLI